MYAWFKRIVDLKFKFFHIHDDLKIDDYVL